MKLVVALLLLLLLGVPAASAVEAIPVITPPAIEAGDIPIDNVLPVSEEGYTELELLTSINTYLTYLFVFGFFFVFVECGKLLYRFFNLFFKGGR